MGRELAENWFAQPPGRVRFRVLKDFLALRPVFHWTERRVRGHVAVCVIAAFIEALMRNALRDADVA